MSGILAIVPARGGSKGIPQKNLVDLGACPLIHYTLSAAQTALAKGVVSRLLVSTDSLEIAACCEDFGVPVPFLRPAKLAGDLSPSVSLVEHAVCLLRDQGEFYEKKLCSKH